MSVDSSWPEDVGVLIKSYPWACLCYHLCNKHVFLTRFPRRIKLSLLWNTICFKPGTLKSDIQKTQSDCLVICSENGWFWLVEIFDSLRRKSWNPCVSLCCWKVFFKPLNPFSGLRAPMERNLLLNFRLGTEDMQGATRITLDTDSLSLIHDARCGWTAGGLLPLVVCTEHSFGGYFLCPGYHLGSCPQSGTWQRMNRILFVSKRVSYSLFHL